MYNSFGTLDENAINDLSLITQFANYIQLTAEGGVSTEQVLPYYTPKFIWLLRDFMLEIQDSRGNPITPSQYLENALADQATFMRASANNKKVRQTLLNYFKDRDCLTVSKPVQDEQLLQRLNTLADNQLRPEFLQQLSALREKIVTKVSPKQLKGVNLNIHMMMSVIEAYIDALNAGKAQNLSSA